MALNRFTAIWFPLKHHILWNRQWYTFLITCIPILQIIWRINEPAEFVYFSESTGTIRLKNLEIQSLAYSVLTATYLFTTFLAAVFNFLAFVKFYFHKSASISVTQLKEKHLLCMYHGQICKFFKF